MMECIHTANRTVLGRVIEGRTPVREIQWDLEPADSGCSKVGLSIRRKPGRYLAGPACWPILNPAACLGGLSSWMEGANPGPETFQGGENLFELWETDAGLVCWVRGQKYKLVPMEEASGHEMIKNAVFIPASRSAVFAALTGYSKYEEWLPGCEQCTVVSVKGPTTCTEFVLNMTPQNPDGAALRRRTRIISSDLN